MGKHILLLPLGLSLLMSSLLALQCFRCISFDSTGFCYVGRHICQTYPDEICAWVVVTTRDGKFVYGNQSCAECNATTVEHGSLIVSTNCCSATPFCNMVHR
ncbi:urinary protein 3 [Rattus norvegicus]|uniref:Urinary protein 3 n=1 Tax=Rattus norvegicus TaxID=10116 RepID=UP3_RAT|nr:RecName: Full=Urinary protein 3; Short=UP-3; Short=rUP-3; Flags: Precursor [Rattus norvegicus]